MQHHLRRGIAVTMSTIVHLLLLWVFATKLAGDLPRRQDEKGILTLIDLSEDRTDRSAAPPAASATSAAAPSADVDLSTESELPPPEWAIVRLPPGAEPVRPQPRAASAQGAGAGSAAGSAGVYDPFAGAAPMRREGSESAGTAALSAFELDARALEEIVRAVRRELRQARGSAEFVVNVSAAGRVIEARLVGGTASDRAKAALGRALTGGALFRPRRDVPIPQSIRLPSIMLG